MAQPSPEQLSRRERQIMDIIYMRGQASVAEVMGELADSPGYSAVRTLLNILERKGFLRHSQEGARFIYAPVDSRDHIGLTMLQRVTQTFFGGSVEKVVAALISTSAEQLSPEKYEEMARLIEQARKEGR